MATLKELSKRDELFSGGHRLCSGCGIPPIVRLVLRAANGPVVATTATGCLEVGTTIYPYTAWRIPWIHSAFENAAATISGIETAYRCYDNGAYMNTGIQRSGATPFGAATTTSPAGDVIVGKPESRKDLTRIVVAHNVPYAAQASPHNWADLSKKAEKAFKVNGPSFLNVISPCPLGWYSKPEESIEAAKVAVDTCYWVLYEVENGVLKINYKPKEKKPIAEWLKMQARFKHLLKPENKELMDKLQENIDKEWERLLSLDGKVI